MVGSSPEFNERLGLVVCLSRYDEDEWKTSRRRENLKEKGKELANLEH
jgi:hypothetical protein